MNLNQVAHGDREYVYINARLQKYTRLFTASGEMKSSRRNR